jgi:hypothetical protein
MAARGFAVPEEFKFSNDAKVRNGQAAPKTSANEMQQLMGKLATVLNAPHMMTKPWKSSTFAAKLNDLHTAFEGTVQSMAKDASGKRQQSGTLKVVLAPVSSASASYVELEAAEFIATAYVELDAVLSVLPRGQALSTDTFEPPDKVQRFCDGSKI